MLLRVVVMIAFTVMIMMMMVVSVGLGRPRRKRVHEFVPTVRAIGQFRIGQQAGIELGLKGIAVEIECHESESLPAIAEGFLPFCLRALRHLGLAARLIASRPPGAG